MASTQGTADVVCPFYSSHSNKSITCEGCFDKSRMTLRFDMAEDKKAHFVLFCCRDYQQCEMYCMVMRRKYSDEGG